MKILVVDDVQGWRNFHKQVLLSILNDNIKIDEADCAENAYNLILENSNEPYDYILTDLQMEDMYYPKMAGEWLVEQIKSTAKYYNTKIIIISASYKVQQIADSYGVFCIPKSTARICISAYKDIIN